MEGQGFNPAPTPAQPEPQPAAAPFGNVAQPNPAEPQAGEVAPAEVPAGDASAKKPKKALIIGIIVAVVVLIGIVVAVVALSNPGDSGKKEPVVVDDGGDDKPKELTKKEKAQNKLRESDIERFLGAVNTYEAANGGVSPFGTEFDAKKIGEFVKNFIDDGIDLASVKSGEPLKCTEGNECKTIEDPDGKSLYGWTVDLAPEAVTDVKIPYSNEKVDYIVHVYAHAICGTKEGTLISGSNDNQVAMFYVEQGGKIVCGDSVSGLSNPGDETNATARSITRRNVLRENDMARMLKSIAEYQADNGGKTPFGEIVEASSNDLATNYTAFVKRYVDSDVLVSTNTGTSCSNDDSCPKFRDPDGTLYNIKVYKPYDMESVINKVRTMNYTIHIVVKGACTAPYSTVVKEAKESTNIAILYRLDGGNKFYCIDNSK